VTTNNDIEYKGKCPGMAVGYERIMQMLLIAEDLRRGYCLQMDYWKEREEETLVVVAAEGEWRSFSENTQRVFLLASLPSSEQSSVQQIWFDDTARERVWIRGWARAIYPYWHFRAQS